VSEPNRYLTFTKERALLWLNKNPPSLSDRTSALVRPIAVARSDADAQILCSQPANTLSNLKQDALTGLARKIRLDRYTAATPVGQQGIAEVIETGPDVEGLPIGQLVVLTSKLSCGGCSRCSAGMSANCELYAADDSYGSLDKPSSHGGLVTDMLNIPHANRSVVALPAALDPVMMSSAGGDLGEAWCSVVPHISRRSSARVLVLGGAARSMSLYAVALIASLRSQRKSSSNVSQLDYIDQSDERSGLAELLGATSLAKISRAMHRQYDFIVSGCVDSGIVRELVELLAVGGSLVQLQPTLLSNTMEAQRVPLTKLYENNVSLITAKPNLLSQARALLEHVEKTQLDVSCINTHTADFAEADQHFCKNTTKVVVHRPKAY